MKKAVAVFFLLIIVLLPACNKKDKVYTDPVTGAQNLNEMQMLTIEGLGKSVAGEKLIVTLAAENFDDRIEYYKVDFNADGTYRRITYQFFYRETDYIDSQNQLSANTYYDIIEQDKENRIVVFEYNESSGMNKPEGTYGTVRSGYENDRIKEYIIVE